MRRVLDALERLLEGVCVLAMALIVGAVSWQVLARYVTQASTAWAPEMAQIAFVWLALLAIPVGVRRSRHMMIDVWFAVRNPLVGKVISTIAMLVVVCVSLVLAYFGYKVLEVTMRRTLPGLDIAAGWMNLAVPVGFALCAIFAVEAWWDEMRGVRLADPDPTSHATV